MKKNNKLKIGLVTAGLIYGINKSKRQDSENEDEYTNPSCYCTVISNFKKEKKRECPRCNGTGMFGPDKCIKCDGDGELNKKNWKKSDLQINLPPLIEGDFQISSNYHGIKDGESISIDNPKFITTTENFKQKGRFVGNTIVDTEKYTQERPGVWVSYPVLKKEYFNWKLKLTDISKDNGEITLIPTKINTNGEVIEFQYIYFKTGFQRCNKSQTPLVAYGFGKKK